MAIKNFLQDVGRLPTRDVIGHMTTGSAYIEYPILGPKRKWIGWSTTEIWPFEHFQKERSVHTVGLFNILMPSRCFHIVVKYTGWRKKTSRTFAGIIHPSSRNVSVQKHMCRNQTSSNMCRNFRLKHFSINRDANKIASHAIKQILQAVYHLRCRLHAGYAKTSQ